MKRSVEIEPKRLFQAADALIAALESGGNGADSLVSMIAGDDRPDTSTAADDVFTELELVEAMDMLIRMGFVKTQMRGE